jgi:hypothetical protein
MRSIKVREVVELIALHSVITKHYSFPEEQTTTTYANTAKKIANAWAALNPEICDKDCG